MSTGMPLWRRLKLLATLLCMAVVAGAVLVMFAARPWFPSLANAVQTRRHTSFSLQMLDREQLLFLVTDRVVTQVVVEHDEHSLLLGGRQGHLITTVSLLYGIDLQELTDGDVGQVGDVVWITVPKPQLLEFAVDPQMHFLSKRSGLVAIADYLAGRDLEDELRHRIKQQAVQFVEQHQLAPDPAVVLSRLNQFAPKLSGLGSPGDVQVQFRYPPLDSEPTQP